MPPRAQKPSCRARERAWAEFRKAGIELPGKYFVPGHRLLAFAAVEGTYFFWQARDDVDPQDWSAAAASGSFGYRARYRALVIDNSRYLTEAFLVKR